MAYKEKANAIKYNNKFIADKYDRINLTVPKGRKAELQAFVEQHGHGQSVNGFINSLIDEALKHERAGVVHDDLSAGDTDAGAEDKQRGAGGGDNDAGEVSIFFDGHQAPPPCG